MHDMPLPGSLFDPIDLHFARFMLKLSGSTDRKLALAASLLSRLSREGHTCMYLHDPFGSSPSEEAVDGVEVPGFDAWFAALGSEQVVGRPGDCRPLILDEAGRLYLHRSYGHERKLADTLRALNARERPFDEAVFVRAMGRMFPAGATDGDPWPMIAAAIAVSRSLCVITGGPGTGKTTLVVKILALLLGQEPGLRIALAAPTGKAAHRIAEAVQRGVAHLDSDAGIKDRIPREASTIHRLLGLGSGTRARNRQAGKTLTADVVVIDEASMADLALMATLAGALGDDARLVLLGDRNQLASVAAGYVLGDICDTGGVHAYSTGFADMASRVTGITVPSGGSAGMQDSVVELTRTYRFREDSPIFALSAAVNRGDAAGALDILGSGAGDELKGRVLPRPDALEATLRDCIVEGYRRFLAADDPLDRLRRFEEFRVLCPVRDGPYGVTAMTRLIECILAGAGMLEPAEQFYSGRPVLVTENDYTLGLFNGDIGIVVREGDTLRACFTAGNGSVRRISPLRMPAHETAWAMTVHKSQGSEFDRVLFVLPDRDSPVLTRELIYTGITRARNSLEIWTRDEILAGAVSRRTLRGSGLGSLLWGTQR